MRYDWASCKFPLPLSLLTTDDLPAYIVFASFYIRNPGNTTSIVECSNRGGAEGNGWCYSILGKEWQPDLAEDSTLGSTSPRSLYVRKWLSLLSGRVFVAKQIFKISLANTGIHRRSFLGEISVGRQERSNRDTGARKGDNDLGTLHNGHRSFTPSSKGLRPIRNP